MAKPLESLEEQREWLRVTLASIGDAVVTTDTQGDVTFLNPIAESLTGWSVNDAVGQPLTRVFHIVNEQTREHVESPTVRALRDGVVVGLANHTVLIAKDGVERPIDDSAAPIRKATGQVAGVVLVFRDVTERRRTELAQGRLAAIIDSSDDAIISKTLDGQILTWNKAAERLLGYTAAEIVGRPVTVLIPPERRDEETGILQRLQRGERIDHFETVRRAKDGKLVDVALTISPVMDSQGHVIGASKILRDITERKRIDIERARLAAIVESSDDAIISKTLDGHILTWNRAAERLLGYTAAEIVGRPVTVLIPPDRQHEEPRILERLKRGEHVEHYETVRRRKDGRLLDVSLTISPIRDSAGRVVGASKIMRDVSEFKRTAEALQRSEVRYRRLFEAAYDGILILDARTGITADANPFLLKMLGYTLDELRDKELWQIGILSDVETSRSAIRQLQEKGYLRYDYLPLETKTGEQIQVEVIANVYREDHQPVIQCNIRDITDRRRLEVQASEQAKTLADMHRRKDEFLAMLSHELRNPLAPILNAVQLLRLQQEQNPLQQEAQMMIERQVGHMVRLVDDLLEVSRITTGRIHLQEELVDFRTVVRRALETARPLADQKSHTVAERLPAEPIWMVGDPVRLEQVVVNLLNNAFKYTDRGGHIWVGLEQAGQEAVLRVRDNGIGIAPEVLPHVFELFSQADRTLDRSQGGLGVGLALVRSLVMMHRGHVEAQSTPGRGSEFIVTLPIAEARGMSATRAVPTATSAPQGLKVLVVDDNADAANGVAMLLRASGYEARTAHNGPKALQLALEYRPRAALLDIGLPGVDGYELAQWIRQEPALKNMVLIALTGYGQESDRQRTRDAGIDFHLVKPADFAKIQQILGTIRA